MENLFEKEFELVAIWFDKPIHTGEDITTNHITEGMTLTINDGKISNTQFGDITHKVLGCFGTLNNSSLNFMLWNFKTLQPEIFKIK